MWRLISFLVGFACGILLPSLLVATLPARSIHSTLTGIVSGSTGGFVHLGSIQRNSSRSCRHSAFSGTSDTAGYKGQTAGIKRRQRRKSQPIERSPFNEARRTKPTIYRLPIHLLETTAGEAYLCDSCRNCAT